MKQEEFEYALLQADMYFKEGNDALNKNEFEKAKMLFKTAIDIHPQTDMHKAILMLGITYHFLGDYENSLENLLYSYSKKDYNCNYFIALNYSYLKDYQNTIEYCKRCIEIDENQTNIFEILDKATIASDKEKRTKEKTATDFLKLAINTEEEFVVKQNGQFEGNIINNKKEGLGTIIFPDGRKYVGEFKNDKYCGNGIFTFENGEKYIGEFENDLYYGNGTLNFANGSKYIGQFVNGKREGKGTMIFSNGNIHEGEYKDDLINGFGKLTYVSGNRYEGQFLCNKFHGKGKYFFVNGNIWEGFFFNDKQNGDGILTTAKGVKYLSNYKEGVRVSLEKIDVDS
jgi:hypothetical protein